MPQQVVDPHVIPVITLTGEEIAEYRLAIPNFDQLYAEERARNTFGHNYKKDRNGRPIEQGLGSAMNRTFQHFEAVRRWVGEAEYNKQVAREWKENPANAQRLNLPGAK